MAGLREQKKAETREAISLAAARLAGERGLDCVTVDDIAEAARVARRTFRNYFPNKESAILHAVDVFVAHYVRFLVGRADAEPLLVSLEEAAVALVGSPHPVDRVLTVRRLSVDAPALRVRWAGTDREARLVPLTAVIAERTGTDPAVDVYPRVVAHAAWGVLVSALDMHSGADDDSGRLIERLRAGFATLASGMSPTWDR
ncbi:TetR family transcriptional regulator [Mycolicibacterium arenosum]|uniref:TetR/AcrR family transcriptional regulator n=1 Tax=Mycolicibacterium arenosum TaxID=2952157 RepID=A0ABT1M754_9MYCO|nr:TetR family transcriptional regulator [Mycolicibacterium sp. CAU 1645]MCP9274627.1 TetR/AcrR family transcriptional regulator [Mycolicibacterium sp. CAU 1645]